DRQAGAPCLSGADPAEPTPVRSRPGAGGARSDAVTDPAAHVRGFDAGFSAPSDAKRSIKPANITLGPGGRADDPAITWQGHTISYAELDELIARSPVGRPLDVSDLALPEALACAFAAARAGTSVLVRDPAVDPPRLGAVPEGTWLVA